MYNQFEVPGRKDLPPQEKWSYSIKHYVQYLVDLQATHHILESGIAEALAAHQGLVAKPLCRWTPSSEKLSYNLRCHLPRPQTAPRLHWMKLSNAQCPWESVAARKCHIEGVARNWTSLSFESQTVPGVYATHQHVKL